MKDARVLGEDRSYKTTFIILGRTPYNRVIWTEKQHSFVNKAQGKNIIIYLPTDDPIKAALDFVSII